VKHLRLCRLRFVALLLVGCLPLLPCGCEDDSDDSGPTDTTGLDLTGEVHPNFPDGLHPDAEGHQKIASSFAGRLSPVGNAADTVVLCVGDSITEGGYPGPLAGMTGMQVIDEGLSGERSGRGLDRLPGLLGTHNPDYVCILYGANDIIDSSPVGGIVNNLVAMVNAVKNAGAVPVVGTLTPMSGSYGWHQPDIDDLNGQIRGTVAGAGARIADLAGRF